MIFSCGRTGTWRYKVVLGHESVGVVVEIGEMWKTFELVIEWR